MRTYIKTLYKYSLVALTPLLAISGCSREQDVPSPSFDVTVNKTKFAKNEAITFNIAGDAEVVTFFSGASYLTEYKYKERDRIEGGKAQMTFESLRTGTSTQPNTLSVLISKNFSGIITRDDIEQATWTDITSRATLSPGTGTVATASGTIDLSDFYTPNVPVYIAFKYKAPQDATAQPTWTVNKIEINNISAAGTFPIATSGDINWGISSFEGPALWTPTAASGTTPAFIRLTGGAANTEANEDWAITKGLTLDFVQRARGISIKPSPVTTLTKYTFPGYSTPGTYTVSFEAINANRWDKKTTVKEFTITVE